MPWNYTDARCRSRDSLNATTTPMMGYEFCDLEEESVERFVGANNIIEHLTSNTRRIYLRTP